MQRALLDEDFEEADRLTSCVLRELAGDQAVKRGYVDFSEVPPMEGLDLTTLDRLWIAYSQGRFGFTVQARLLKALDGRYDRLWPRRTEERRGEKEGRHRRTVHHTAQTRDRPVVAAR